MSEIKKEEVSIGNVYETIGNFDYWLVVGVSDNKAHLLGIRDSKVVTTRTVNVTYLMSRNRVGFVYNIDKIIKLIDSNQIEIFKITDYRLPPATMFTIRPWFKRFIDWLTK